MRRFSVCVLLGVMLTAWSTAWAGPFRLEARMLPVVDGYCPGRALPLALLVRLPEGFGARPGRCRLELSAAEGWSLGGARVVWVKARGGWAVVAGQLKLPRGERKGLKLVGVRGTITLVTPQGGERLGVFEARMPVVVLGEGRSPRVLSPKMMRHLGVEVDGSPARGALAGKGLLWVMATVFLMGLGLNLTPCVYPLIPITLAYFGGRGAGGRGRVVAEAVAYWGGMSVMYAALGVGAALGGGMLGQALTNPIVCGVVAGVIVLMGLSMFGLWEIRMPRALMNMASRDRGGIVGAGVMGLGAGVLAAPCIGPVILGVMAHVAAQGRVGYGLVVFLSLAAGLGLPLAVLAGFSESLASRLPRAGEWMNWVRAGFGVVLVAMGGWVLKPVVGEEGSWAIVGVVVALGGVYLGLVERSRGGKGFMWLKRLVGAGLVVAGLVVLWKALAPPPRAEGVQWRAYSPGVLAEAAREGKPVVVDFWASWCGPCQRMEEITFRNPMVVEAMKDFVAVRVDLTSSPSREVRELMLRWGIRGVPTLVFLDTKGRRMQELTVVGYRGPSEMLEILSAAKERAGGG